MPSIYHETHQIAASGSKLLFGVSLGRDTACMLHLFKEHAPKLSKGFDIREHAFVHWTPYDKMIPYQARLLQVIQDRYGIIVDVRPDPVNWAMKGIRSIAEERDACIEHYQAKYMVMGYRMDESLQRRGMLKKHTDGLNDKLHEAYPLRSWTSRITDTFVKTNRIQLAPEYAYGLRDCRNHRGMKAVWLRKFIGEADYQAAVAQDPQVEVDYVRNLPIFEQGLLQEEDSDS